MSAVVIDASIAIAILRSEEVGPDSRAELRRWRADGTKLLVPTHFWLEVANGLMSGHRWPGVDTIEAVHRLDEFGLTTVEITRPLVLLAIDRAERFAITLYDAAYLAVAESVDALLFTADHALLQAAGERGIDASSQADHRLSEAPAPYGPERQATWPDYARISAYLSKLRAEAGKQPVRPTMSG